MASDRQAGDGEEPTAELQSAQWTPLLTWAFLYAAILFGFQVFEGPVHSVLEDVFVVVVAGSVVDLSVRVVYRFWQPSTRPVARGAFLFGFALANLALMAVSPGIQGTTLGPITDIVSGETVFLTGFAVMFWSVETFPVHFLDIPGLRRIARHNLPDRYSHGDEDPPESLALSAEDLDRLSDDELEGL